MDDVFYSVQDRFNNETDRIDAGVLPRIPVAGDLIQLSDRSYYQVLKVSFDILNPKKVILVLE